MLIAIEGIDQSGKATLAAGLKTRLEERGETTRILSFPDYETPTGRLIAQILAGEAPHDAASMQLLNAANRNEHRAALKAAAAGGGTIICDRYKASAAAYGRAQGLPGSWLDQIDSRVPTADCTVLVDASPKKTRGRKTAGRDRYERDRELLKEVRRQYRLLAERGGWIVVDGAKTPDEVLAETWTELRQIINPVD